jgi:hypothetical protein
LLIQKKRENYRAFVLSSLSSAIAIFFFSQVYLRKLTDSVHRKVLYLCTRSSKPSYEVSGQDITMVEGTAMNTYREGETVSSLSIRRIDHATSQKYSSDG